MKRWAAAIAVLAAGAVMLAGCAETQGDVGNRNIKEKRVLKDGNGNLVIDRRFADDQLNEQNRVYGRRLNSNNLIGSHQNYRMEASQDIAERIRKAEGFSDVYVILTDRNAYVAVNERIDAGDRLRRGAAGDNGLPSSRTNSRAGLNNRASGGTTGNSGGTLEERIARHVKEMAPQIERVYVSEEPDFVSRMSEYIQTARRGEPIQGFIAQFNAMVERLFPAESGIRISRTGSSSIYD
jgi:Sporulation lipoprotein YhcN/YlaJ (Spore_YhcN_YlaJ).